MRMRVVALLLALVAAPAQQIIIVERNVNLRRDPSTAQQEIRLLKPPEELELLDPQKTNNYFKVFRAESQDTGWVWASNVRLEDAPIETFTTGPIASAIDSTWAKPSPVVGTFRSPVRDTTCGPNGDGGDTGTNRLKNRTDVPGSYHAVSFDAIADLAYPATPTQSRLGWPPDSLAKVTRYEGVPVSVIGYLVALKLQNGGSGETTNCHLNRVSETDWHMAIVEEPGQGEAESIVVETTPRVRINHPKWTAARLQPWVDAENPVRISGWLMFDPQHRNHLDDFRKTLWEIHPITRIEVWHNGAWVNVDDLP